MSQEISRRKLLGLGAAAAGGLMLGSKLSVAQAAGGGKNCVVVWSEGTAPKNVYPNDINGAVAEGLAKLDGWEVVKAGISDPEQGITDDLLKRCDVLIWWGHKKHGDVKDALVQKIVKRVKEEGMGFISLHSSHFAKPNKALMGTPCSWKAYKGDSIDLKIIVKDASHPIAQGVKDFTIKHSERYSDPYAVPEPKAVVFEGTATLKDGGTDTSKIGFCWEVGKGKMFYLQAGHETNPVFMDESICKIMANAVKWATPTKG
ncbi:MAG: ThuA domain-containing protein [Candidatus Sumerlaeota bacterium]|nr:ThuA domain-containing protein [Candidatus Sumerlaeota bacterium]